MTVAPGTLMSGLAWVALGSLGLGLGAAVAWGASRMARPFPSAWLPVIAFLETLLVLWTVSLGEPFWTTAASIILSACLLTLAVVDLAVLRLPNLLTLPLVLLGLAAAAHEKTGLLSHCAGALAGWLLIFGLAVVFRRLRGREGIGMGDAKLLAAVGAWCGWRALPFTVMLACLLAFTWICLRFLRPGRADPREPVPFGAPLALAFWVVRLYGAPV